MIIRERKIFRLLLLFINNYIMKGSLAIGVLLSALGIASVSAEPTTTLVMVYQVTKHGVTWGLSRANDQMGANNEDPVLNGEITDVGRR